jgi:hypothetical protein
MEQTITLTISDQWLPSQNLDQAQLRRVLQLGLDQLHREQAAEKTSAQVVHALLKTGHVRHLAPRSELQSTLRQEPPTLPGLPVSELLIAQRRGES